MKSLSVKLHRLKIFRICEVRDMLIIVAIAVMALLAFAFGYYKYKQNASPKEESLLPKTMLHDMIHSPLPKLAEGRQLLKAIRKAVKHDPRFNVRFEESNLLPGIGKLGIYVALNGEAFASVIVAYSECKDTQTEFHVWYPYNVQKAPATAAEATKQVVAFLRTQAITAPLQPVSAASG